MQALAKSIAADADRVYDVLRAGGVALVPVDVGYALLAIEEPALRRIYQLKGRPLAKPCVTVVDDAIFDDLVLPVHADVRQWIARTASVSPLAVIARLDPRSRLRARHTVYVHAQTTRHGTIATLHGAGPLVTRIAARAYADGHALCASSANASGTGNSYAVSEVPQLMRLAVDVVVDRGRTRYVHEARLGATMLDLESGVFTRAGINHAQIAASWASLWSRRLVA